MFTILASFCMGGAVFCLFMLLADLLGKVEVDTPPEELEIRKLPLIFRICLPLAGNFTFITKKEFLNISRRNTAEMIQSAGFDQTLSVDQFYGIRIMLGILGGLFLILVTAGGKPLPGILFFLVMILYPTTWLKKTIRLRHLSILKELPNVLDLLTLSVEAGKDFLTSLRDILARRPEDILGSELKRTLHEIQLGKQRQTALRDLSERLHHPELTSVINAIVQADELGVGIGQLLRIQGDQLRQKRFARAETLANEAPVKILFPVVLFIFPSVFIILIAPILYQAMQTLSV